MIVQFSYTLPYYIVIHGVFIFRISYVIQVSYVTSCYILIKRIFWAIFAMYAYIVIYNILA